MTKFNLILSTVVVLSLGILMYMTYSIHKKVNVHEVAITEIATVIKQSGLIVPDKDGRPTINQILLEVWKQSQNERP